MPTFHKSERLCNRSVIDSLFREGQKIHATPLLAFWNEPAQPMEVPLKVLVTVSKKHFPHAVDRNRLKRRMREAFRLNKAGFSAFLESGGKQCILSLLYTGSGNDSLKQMESKILLILQRLQKAYEKTAG